VKKALTSVRCSAETLYLSCSSFTLALSPGAYCALVERLCSHDAESQTLALCALQHGSESVSPIFPPEILLKLGEELMQSDDPCLVLMSFCCIVTEMSSEESAADCILMPLFQPVRHARASK
jgi:hypothetical protein